MRRLALSLAFLLWPFCAWAGFGTPANVGTANASNATSVTLSATATAGNLLIGVACEKSTLYASGTVSDTVNSSWTRITGAALNGGVSNGGCSVFYVASTGALSSTTVTFTAGAKSALTLSIFQVSGQAVSPLDSGVTTTATGSSLAPSVTGGAPSVANELIIGAVGWNSTDTFTQDSTNGAYATPPNAAINAQWNQASGNIIYSGTSARTYAPVLVGTGTPWADIMVGFKPLVAASTLCTILLMGAGPC